MLKLFIRAFSFVLIALNIFPCGAHAQHGLAYKEEEAILTTKTGKLSGTLCVPAESDTKAVVLIIAGSGPTDRNGNNPMMKNNALQMMARQLSEAGIASLRYDKRGIGASEAAGVKEEDLRFEHLVQDAADWLAWLKKTNRFPAYYILGHSEGSLIGMLASKGATGFISLAGPGETAGATLRRQLSAQPKMIKDESFAILDSLDAGHTVQKISPMLAGIFRAQVQPYLISWMKYDPAKIIADMNIPVCIIQGSTDIQVEVEDARKLSAAQPSAKLVIIEGMNHVLKTSDADRLENMKTYNNPDLPLADKLVPEIISFIQSR